MTNKKLRQVWIYEKDLYDLHEVIEPLYKKKSGRNDNERISNAILLNECIQTLIHNQEWLK